MIKRYTVSDGKMVLNLEEAEEGGYVVTSPETAGSITDPSFVRHEQGTFAQRDAFCE